MFRFAILTAALLVGASGFTLVQFPCQMRAWADEIREFGRDGDDGRDGRSGRPGQDGPDRTITANGRPQQVYVSGGDGRDGERGERGERADCDPQPHRPAYNLEAPDGGDGGDGGSGGDGGNGGDVTIYYPQRAALRQIWIQAQGGRGGRGGRGGDGAAGCRCDRNRWTVTECDDSDDNCAEERYYCRDGRDGRNGRYGTDGQPGQPGQVWLVPQTERLSPDQPRLTLPLETLLDRPVELSRHLWESRSGAQALLAAGSIVADTYQQYQGRIGTQLQLQWSAPRPAIELAREPIRAVLQPDGQIRLTFPEDLWTTGQWSSAAARPTYTVTGAVRATEATQLSWGRDQGRGNSYRLSVIDLGRVSDYLTTEFHVTIATTDDDPRDDRRPRYSVQYEGRIPADRIQRRGNRFTLAIGQLPGHLRAGTYAEIELTVERALGEHAAQQTLFWQGQI